MKAARSSGQRVYTKVSSGTITSEDYYVGNIYEESYSIDSSSPIISASTTTVTYVYAGSIRVAGLTSQATATGTENNTCYYHGDHLGSSSVITDGSGTVVRNISYQPWGNVHSNTEESGATTLDPNHKFTGQILDDSTDLYYYGARYYDPVLRRFITPDTIVQSPYDPQSLNRYAYCRNNPLIYVDPSGHWRLDNFLVSTLQVASYASMFAGGWEMPIAIASSMAQTGLQSGHLDDAIQAGAIGGVSSLIGQGVALGIGPAGLGEGFGRTVVAGAGAGFASGGIGALMSGQSGSAVWQSAFQGAAMGAATAGVMWGIQQGVASYQSHQAEAAAQEAAQQALLQSLVAGPGAGRTPINGDSNSKLIIKDGDQTTHRYFDKNGRAIKDIDYGHNHSSSGDPHQHNWDYSKQRPRCDAQPIIQIAPRLIRFPGPFPIIFNPSLIQQRVIDRFGVPDRMD